MAKRDVPLEAEPPGSIRVALICPYSLTIPGGVQGQVLGLARALRRRGHEVRVLGPCDGAPPETYVTPLGDSLPTAVNGSIAPLAPDPSAALRTIRALRDEDFDVLHVHEPLSPGPSMTTLLMRTAPIVATFHAAGDSASYRYLNSVVRNMANSIDLRFAVSKDALELAERYLGGEYEVLPNGVELDRYFDGQAESERERAIFFCGRHEPRKGLEVLLKAHGDLPADVQLWIASDGPETSRLMREWSGDSRIHWLGRISDTEKLDRLRRSSVFCAPSLGGESFGVVLLEAMASGSAVVASAIEGYQNVASNGHDSLLTAPGDVELLREALNAVIDDSTLRFRLVEAGRRRALEFSMDALADSYVSAYRRVLSGESTAAVRPTYSSRLLRVFQGLVALIRRFSDRRMKP